ncbi:MAG: RNA methyltransferase [Cyanobacteriota bacterium]|nr:RNA methyltransferase [Cyanobacteriota bacterium]
MNNLDHLRIVLVEPAGPRNVGSVARVMKNMGLKRLALVNPHCDPLDPEARQMAVHAQEILETCRLAPSLTAALEGCQRAVATTAQPRSLALTLETPRQVLPWLQESPAPGALIFGREDKGLTNEEINQAHRCIGIPAHPDYSSLNLAQAVGICAYELYQSREPALSLETEPLAPLEQIEGYFQHLEKTLLNIGVLYPHTAPARMAKLRRLYQRSGLSPSELALLRGILGQVDWLWQQFSSRRRPGETE